MLLDTYMIHALLLILKMAVASGHIECFAGHMRSSTKNTTGYKLTNMNVTGKCNVASSTKWPGSPIHFEVSRVGDSLTFTWRSPDDVSANFLRGFLLRMYVDTYSGVQLSTRPTCYQVILPDEAKTEEFLAGNLIQDTQFTLRCRSYYGEEVAVTAYLKSTPSPPPDRTMNGKTVTITINSNSPPQPYRQVSSSTASPTHVETSTRRSISTSSHDYLTVTIVAVCGLIVAVVVTVTLAFIYRLRSRHNDGYSCPQTDVTHEKSLKFSAISSKRHGDFDIDSAG